MTYWGRRVIWKCVRRPYYNYIVIVEEEDTRNWIPSSAHISSSSAARCCWNDQKSLKWNSSVISVGSSSSSSSSSLSCNTHSNTDWRGQNDAISYLNLQRIHIYKYIYRPLDSWDLLYTFYTRLPHLTEGASWNKTRQWRLSNKCWYPLLLLLLV